jgi:DHA1 family multidrug resistance protein-like MFS transporter
MVVIDFLKRERDCLGIYLSALMVACAISIAFTALPFVIKRFDGSDAAAGATVSAFHVLYLVICALSILFIDQLRPKLTVIVSLAVQSCVCVLLWATIRFNDSLLTNPVQVVVLLSGLWGLGLVFFWPPLMGWLTLGYEGQHLNRKLGLFNTSWSSGATIGPLIGGCLAGVNIQFPFAAAVILLAISIVMISASPSRRVRQFTALSDAGQEAIGPSPQTFKIAARIMLFAGFFCLGLCKAPLGMLMKYELSLTEAHFGAALSIIALSSTFTFFVLGKYPAWHYKHLPMLVAQVGLAVALLMIILFDKLAALYTAAGLIGASSSFVYTAHMFYGISSTKKRSGAMTVHEIILAAAIGIGAYVGGYLSDEFGRRYAPYLFGLVVIGIAATTQQLADFSGSSGDA